MKKMVAFLVIAFAFSQTVQARDSYDRTYDSIYIANKIYYSLDKELGRNFRKLRHYLSPRGKRLLKESENDWIYRRDHRCAYPSTNSVNINCAVRVTRQRLYFLKERLRECQEVGCKLNRL